MLPSHYRTQIDNQCGATITSATIRRRGRRFASDGSLEFEGSATTIHSGSNITTGTQDNGTIQDNTTAGTKHVETDLEITLQVGGTPSGDVVIRLQRSLDGGIFPDDQIGDIVKTFTIDATGTYRDVTPVS